RRGRRAALEVVGVHDRHARELLDMAMAVDAAGKHIAAASVDIARTGWKAIRDGDDLLAADADVATRRLGGRRHGAVADGEVELVHGLDLSLVRAQHNATGRFPRTRMKLKTHGRYDYSAIRERK